MTSRLVLRWEVWAYGLFAGFVGGGANAVVTTVTVTAIAPDKFNLTTQLHNFLLLMSITFLTSGFLSAMAYLAKSPLPPIVEQVETDKTITPTPDGGVHIATTTTTTTDKTV